MQEAPETAPGSGVALSLSEGWAVDPPLPPGPVFFASAPNVVVVALLAAAVLATARGRGQASWTRLRAWRAAGKRLYVYSSGSVAAQQLFFAHSEAGDLTALFDGFFDTTSGGKREAASYRRIAEAVAAAPDSILFLSDVEAELDAAASSGMRTILLARPPARCPADGRHRCVPDFDAIDPA